MRIAEKRRNFTFVNSPSRPLSFPDMFHRQRPKARGQRRYYRRLARPVPLANEIEEWIEYLHRPGPGPCYDRAFYDLPEHERRQIVAERPDLELGYDFDHLHFDRSGSPLFRWEAIEPHLDAAMRTFAELERTCADAARPFQCWLHLGMQPDFGMSPTLYFHTPNALCDYFPHTERSDATACNWPTAAKITAYLERLNRQGYTVLFAAPSGRFADIYTSVSIYKKGFGTPLVERE